MPPGDVGAVLARKEKGVGRGGVRRREGEWRAWRRAWSRVGV